MVRELSYLQNSSNVLEVRGLKNTVTGAYLTDTDAVVARIRDRAGTDVAGATWPQTLAYVAASSGVFRVTLPAGLIVTVGAWYDVLITVTSGPLTSVRRLPLVVVDS